MASRIISPTCSIAPTVSQGVAYLNIPRRGRFSILGGGFDVEAVIEISDVDMCSRKSMAIKNTTTKVNI